jgi:hypothetical protein
MKFSGILFSVHPVKGRVERTVVLDEIVYSNQRYWKSKAGWYNQTNGRDFNPRAKWSLDLTTITPLDPDSPLLHPVRQPRKSAPRKPEQAESVPEYPNDKKVGGKARSKS